MRFIKTFFIFYFADLQRFTTTLKNKVCNSFLFCHSFSTSLAIQLSIKPNLYL